MMDRRFDMMDFEQSLKDHADQFRLTPSKRIWNGIYNNLHPGSKWPSMTMAIVIIITLISVGYLNNSSKNLTSNVVSLSTIDQVHNDSKLTNNNNFILENNFTETAEHSFNSINAEQSDLNGKLSAKMYEEKKLNIKTEKQEEFTRSSVPPKKSYSANAKVLSDAGKNITPDQISTKNLTGFEGNSQNLAVEKNENPSSDFALIVKQDKAASISITFAATENAGNTVAPVSIENTIYVVSPSMINSSSPIETGIQELKKTTPKKSHLKRNKNIEWTYYITPTISNAVFSGSPLSSSFINYSPLTVFQRSSSSNGMIYNAKFGFETGAKMTYALPKKWKFVTGFNLNYSDYNVVSNPIHPTFATLMLKDKASGVLYPKNYITFYGDGRSYYQTGLNNYSLQLSIPIGLEYQVWGNEKMQINIASAIEPSVVLKSHSYIISNDSRYYVEDPDLMRKVNLGANLGTFISFGSNKIKWHIGPDLHYQLLSTYKGIYPGKEHLINYGIRIGISKKY